MKKLIYLLLFIPLGVFGQTQIVNVGATANDHTGDPLRTAFQKVNINTFATQDSFAIHRVLFGNIYTKTQTRTLVADSLDALRDSALLGSDYFFLEADSNEYGGAITRTWFETYGGGGGTSTGGYEWTNWIVGTTSGAPANATTNITISAFAGDRIKLYRGTDGNLVYLQHLNEGDTNTIDGYRYNSSGRIIVRPAWATGDIAYAEAVPQGYTTKVVLTGGGGGSTLLTDLVGSWDLNETSGSLATDNIGTYNGTYANSPLLNQSGKFGVAPDFDGTDDYVTMGTAAGLRLQTFSVSCWVNTSYSGAYKGIVANHIARSAVPYGFAIMLTTTGKVEATVYYTGGAYNQITSSTSVNTGAWVNIIYTFNGTNSNIYIDNSASEDTDATAGTIIFHAENQFRIGDKSDVDYPFDGKIDAVHYWSKVLSAGERTLLQTYTHPFE